MGSDVKYTIDSAIGKVFKSYRKKQNLTQDQIAEKLDISEKYIGVNVRQLRSCALEVTD